MPSSSILREIAELSNPQNLDYDPEDIEAEYKASDDDEVADDGDLSREHYVDVRYIFLWLCSGSSKSKLKGINISLQDAKYRGKKVSRKDLFQQTFDDGSADSEESSNEDENEDQAMDSDDNEEDDLQEDSEESLGDESDGSSDEAQSGESENEFDVQEEDQESRREQVRRLLEQEHRCHPTFDRF
jgi:protein AATF/BFR2